MAWSDYENAYNTLNENLKSRSRELTDTEMELIRNMLADADARSHLPDFEVYNMASHGDFSQFEKVGHVLRNYLASRVMRENDLQDGNTSVVTQDMLERNAMNPAFRLGISQLSHTYDQPGAATPFRDYDDQMNAYIMRQTLKPMDAQQIQTVKRMSPNEHEARKDILRNVEKQVLLAKTLFMAHIGNTQIKDANGQSRVPDCTAAGMMAHCSRAAYVFPPAGGEQLQAMMSSITGPDNGAAAGVYGRTAATHSTANGSDISDFKEKKTLSFRHQYGMDVAIGGLGRPGIPGKGGVSQTLKNDGSCGHMYMRVDVGNARTTSSLLIGFESDSPSTSNQQGHTHTASATPEYMSSFLGQREDEMGNKYGGRIVDCTRYDPKILTDMMDRFTKCYRSMLLRSMKDPSLAPQMDEINQSLCGKMMSADDLKKMMGNLGFPPRGAVFFAEKAADVRGIPHGTIGMSDLTGSGFVVNEPPQRSKPTGWTRFKAWLGFESAEKHIQEYRDYRNYLKSNVQAAFAESDRLAAAAQTAPNPPATPNPPANGQPPQTQGGTPQRTQRPFSTLVQPPVAPVPPAQPVQPPAAANQLQNQQAGTANPPARNVPRTPGGLGH